MTVPASPAAETGFFCPLPWVHLSVEPSGNVYPCCNGVSFTPLGNLHSESIAEIWNGSALQSLRAQLLSGSIPNGCRQCVQDEAIGLVSLREVSLRRFPPQRETVRKDPPLLRYLGFRADNLCNLSCRMCHPGVSTGWYGDARALGQSVPEGLVAALADDSSREQFFEFILQDLEVLYLAGGEPLLSENTLRLISRLRAANRRNLQIIVNTNLSVTRARAERVISELSFFGDVSLNLSFDAFGSRAEYLRKGQVWEEVEESVRYCRAAFPQIALKVTPTVSILNLLHLPDFVRHLITHLGFDPADFRFSILNSPYHYRPELLPKRLIEVGTTELRLLQKRLIVEFDQARIGMFVTQTNALIRHLSECNSSDDLHEFIAATKELDGLRNERVQEVFPELRELFTENEPLEFAES